MSEFNSIILFQEKQIRRVWHDEQWHFVIVDVVAALTDSVNPADYLKKMRTRDAELVKGWGQIVTPLLVETTGGRQKLNCANLKGIFRLVMSVPSAKAEPFKLWLAQVGQERVQEIENPELAADRARQYYRDLGYDEKWIETRLQTISIRGQLTDEWKTRGVQEGREYAILTAEISRATFGFTPTEHKEHKGLRRENLRDHMTNLELIFTMLGDEGTRREAIKTDAAGFEENREAAIEGGLAAGDALQAYEKRTGEQVVSADNFLPQIRATKRSKQLPDTEQGGGEPV